MFATEVGVDDLGEDAPLEELNRSEVGGFYGFPYWGGLRDLLNLNNYRVPLS